MDWGSHQYYRQFYYLRRLRLSHRPHSVDLMEPMADPLAAAQWTLERRLEKVPPPL